MHPVGGLGWGMGVRMARGLERTRIPGKKCWHPEKDQRLWYSPLRPLTETALSQALNQALNLALYSPRDLVYVNIAANSRV